MSEKGSRTGTPNTKRSSKANTPKGSKAGTPKGSKSNTPLPQLESAAANGLVENVDELGGACKFFENQIYTIKYCGLTYFYG